MPSRPPTSAKTPSVSTPRTPTSSSWTALALDGRGERPVQRRGTRPKAVSPMPQRCRELVPCRAELHHETDLADGVLVAAVCHCAAWGRFRPSTWCRGRDLSVLPHRHGSLPRRGRASPAGARGRTGRHGSRGAGSLGPVAPERPRDDHQRLVPGWPPRPLPVPRRARGRHPRGSTDQEPPHHAGQARRHPHLTGVPSLVPGTDDAGARMAPPGNGRSAPCTPGAKRTPARDGPLRHWTVP